MLLAFYMTETLKMYLKLMEEIGGGGAEGRMKRCPRSV